MGLKMRGGPLNPKCCGGRKYGAGMGGRSGGSTGPKEGGRNGSKAPLRDGSACGASLQIGQALQWRRAVMRHAA